MSGIVSGIDYNVLFSNTSADDASAAILSALYASSDTVPSTTVSTGNPLTDLKLAQQNETVDVAREAKVPQVARAITSFTTAVANAKDINSALANPDILKVLLTANNLSAQVQYPALAQKVLLSDPSDSNSLVNKLDDSAWLSATQTYDFAKNGLAELQKPQVISTLTNAYAEVMWRQSLDQATPGLANALTFLSQASKIQTAYDVLGDATNRTVVTTALGIPAQIAFQDLPAQVTAITDHVDLRKFQDPQFVNTMASQYLLTMQQNAQASSSSNSTDLTTLAAQSAGLVV